MKLIQIVLFSILSSYTYASGSLVGNGGDTIYCSASSENEFQGHYTLDYLLEQKEQNGPIEKLGNFKELNQRIRHILADIYPELLPQFDDFFGQVRIEGENRFWIPSKNGLVDIKDENILKALPKNCLGNDGRPVLYQTVIRKGFLTPIEYHFDDSILTHQEKYNPLQYSFFLTHEWMWDFTRDVRILRKLNWLLHSKGIDRYSRSEIIDLFENWKLFLPKLSYCERSQIIKDLYPDSCENIKARDLRGIKVLHFANLPSSFLFRFGDFHGFGSVEQFTVDGHPKLQQLLNPRMFAPFYRLKQLVLINGNLTSLSSQVTKDLHKLEVLDVRGNPHFKLGAFLQHLESLKTLKLTAPLTIEQLPPKLELIIIDKISLQDFKNIAQQINEINPVIKVVRSHDLQTY